MSFPSTTQTSDHLAAGTSDPKQARSELRGAIDKLNQIITSDGRGWFEEFRLPWIDIANAYNKTESGTGAAITGAVHGLKLNSGSDAAGKVSIGSQLLDSQAAFKLNSSGKLLIFDIAITGGTISGSTSLFYIVLSSSSANPYVANGAFDEVGWRIVGSNLYTYSNKAGTYLETDTGITFAATAMLRIELIGGSSIKWYKDDTLLRTETNTAYIPTTLSANFHALLDNNSGTPSQTRRISQPRISIERTLY